MCSFDFDELQMDARREYLMKDLKKRCKKRQRANKNNKLRRKRQCKTNDKAKSDSTSDRKGKTDSFDEPSGSNHKGKNEVEDLDDNIPKEQDYNSFTKLCDFHNGNYTNHGSSYSNKKEKPLESEADDQEAVNKDGDSSDLDHMCADMLQNTIEQIKTELNTSKENPQKSSRKSNCIKPQRVTFGNLFKRNRKKCAKKKESEDDIENEAIPSTSGFKENGDTSDKSEEETEDVVLYQSKNAGSKFKSRKKQLQINESNDNVEENMNAESKYKSRRKQSEINDDLDICEEVNENNQSKHTSRRKQPEIDESDVSEEEEEEDSRNADSKQKSRRKQKQPEDNESDVSVEEDKSKHKSRRKQPENNRSDVSVEEDKSKHKSRRKQLENNGSHVSVEEDKSKHKSRRKQPENNGSHVSVEEDKSKHKSRRKQPEINESDANVEKDGPKRKSQRKQVESNESDVSVEEDKSEHKSRKKYLESDNKVEESKKNGESKHKFQKKQPAINESEIRVEGRKNVSESEFDREITEICESDMNVEGSKNNEFQRKLINESDIGLEGTKRGEKDYYDFVSKKSFGKHKSKKKPKISSECARYLKESRRKRSRSNGSSKCCLCKPSSSNKFDYPKKASNFRNLECECKKLNPKFSLDGKAILAAKQKEQRSASDLCCMCDEILNNRRKRERSGNSECDKLLKKQKKKKSSPKLSQSRKKLLKTHEKKKKKISSECEKLLKNQVRSRSRSSCSCKKLSDTTKKKKRPSSECEKLLKDVRKKKSATVCKPCNMPRRRSLPRRRTSLPRRRRSYQAPVLEDCGKELKKMNQALSNKIQQKESQLLGSSKKGRRKKKVKSKPELQVTNCRCASSDLKDRYTKMIEDYHRLKRQYDALKCTNALIEKKLRCFMKKSNCKCTK